MVKNIKKGYAKDGKLTDKEKGIAYATTWKAHNKGKVEESIPPGFPKSLAKKIYEQCDGDMKNTLSTMWKVYNSVMESKKSSNKKISEGMKFEQSTTKPAMGTYKGGLWTADPPKKGEVGAPVPSPDEGAPVKQQSKRRPQKEDVSENKELNDVLKLAGMVDESVKVDECGMSPISGAYGDTMQDTEGRMSINTNMSTDGNKTVTITADGDSAVELMQMLKMAGLSADGGEDTDIEKMSEEKDDRYEANTTPEEEVLPVQSQLKGGDGEVAGKEKKMTPHGYKFADNPLAMNESMTLKLMKEYESIKKVK
jgi:ribosome-associated protein YbcJ (S4-like RNA binding protein)